MNAGPPKPDRGLQGRALTTLVTAVAFLIMTISGVVLYVAPRGRVANWTDWNVLGLDKEQWSDMHMAAAVLLLVAMGFHLYFNWKPLCHYLKSRSAAHVMRVRELALALAVALLVVTGTMLDLPPMSLVTAANERIKDAWEPTAAVEGTSVAGRAPSTYVQQASVAEFARRMELTLDELDAALAAHGIEEYDPDTPIDALARRHGVSPRSIYEAAAADAQRGGGAGGGGGGVGGFGRMTLAEHCQGQGLDLDEALAELRGLGVQASGQSRLRDLASELDVAPRTLAEWLAAGR